MARLLSIDVADMAQISYRMLDHWVRKEYLAPRHQSSGTGTSREFSPGEAAVAVEMGALVRVGFTPKAAAPLARELCARREDTAEGEEPMVHVGGGYYLARLSEPPASVGWMGETT